MVLHLQTKNSIRFNVCLQNRQNRKKKEVVCSYCIVSVWEIGPPCAWSDTRPKYKMRTFIKELILPRILVSNNFTEWQYLHTISLCSKRKNAALNLGYLRKDSQKGELWWPLVFSGPSSSGQTGKIQVGRQLEQAKHGANAKARFI